MNSLTLGKSIREMINSVYPYSTKLGLSIIPCEAANLSIHSALQDTKTQFITNEISHSIRYELYLIRRST